MKPYISLIAESLDYDSLLHLKVDREDEIEHCMQVLCETPENIFLYGEAGIGKTFLVRLIQEKILREYPHIFPVYVNVIRTLFEDDVTFPKAILISIILSIWKDVFKNDYLELRKALYKNRTARIINNSAEMKVIEIFKIMMTSHKKSTVISERSIGASAGIKGSLKGTEKHEHSELDILPFEFIEFAKELTDILFMSYDKSKLVVFCDEANKLPLSQQKEMVEKYIQVFTSKNIQFLFVARLYPKEFVGLYPYAAFQQNLEMKGIQGSDNVRTLIKNHFPDSPDAFTDDAVEFIFEAAMGHPVKTISVCRDAFYQSKPDEKVDVKLMAKSWARGLKEFEMAIPPDLR